MENTRDYDIVDLNKVNERLDDIGKSVELALRDCSVYDVIAHLEYLKYKILNSNEED